MKGQKKEKVSVEQPQLANFLELFFVVVHIFFGLISKYDETELILFLCNAEKDFRCRWEMSQSNEKKINTFSNV